MKHPKKLSLLDYKIVVAKHLIQYYQGWKRAVPMSRPSKWKNQPVSTDNHGAHLPNYQTMQKQSRTVQLRVKKIEHLSSVPLVTFHYA